MGRGRAKGGRGLLGVREAPQGWLWISGIAAVRRARCLDFKYLVIGIGMAH